MGSLAYMRMLGNTVDAMADGARGVMKYVLHDSFQNSYPFIYISKITHVSLFFLWLHWFDLIEVHLDSHAYLSPLCWLWYSIDGTRKRLSLSLVHQTSFHWNFLLGTDLHMFGRILVPEYGFMHLELIPMLVGFFTYKIATFFQAIGEAISIYTKKTDVSKHHLQFILTS